MTKLQKLYIPPRNLRVGNKLPALFLKKPLPRRFIALAKNNHGKACGG